MVVGSIALIVYYRSSTDEFDNRSTVRRLLPYVAVWLLILAIAIIVVLENRTHVYGPLRGQGG